MAAYKGFKKHLPASSDWGPTRQAIIVPSVRSLDELFVFIEAWYGPRQPTYGIDVEALQASPMPEPLWRLLAFCGNWPLPHRPDCGLFQQMDRLLLPPYELNEWGTITFAAENQGVWLATVDPHIDDAPVVQRLVDEREDPSLESWLVRFCMREIVFNGPWAPLLGGAEAIQDRTSEIDPLLDAHCFQGDQSIPIWLIDDSLLAMKLSGDEDRLPNFFAARNNEKLDALKAEFGIVPFRSMLLNFGVRNDPSSRHWTLELNCDGSFGLRDDECRMPSGSIDFDDLVLTVSGYRGVSQVPWEHPFPTIVRFRTHSAPYEPVDPVAIRPVVQRLVQQIADANPRWSPPWGNAVPALIASAGQLDGISIDFDGAWRLTVGPTGDGHLSTVLGRYDDATARVPAGTFNLDDFEQRCLAASTEADTQTADHRYRVVFHRWPKLQLAVPPPQFFRELLRETLQVVEPGADFDEAFTRFRPKILDEPVA